MEAFCCLVGKYAHLLPIKISAKEGKNCTLLAKN